MNKSTFKTASGLVIDLDTADEFWLDMFDPENPDMVDDDGGIYVSDGLTVYPDGNTSDD